MSEVIAVRARIRGLVQGVYYRAWTKEQAEARGLAGWVQNMPDGTVLAQFAGPRATVENMLAACGTGPRDASVDAVEVEDLAELPPVSGFEIHS